MTDFLQELEEVIAQRRHLAPADSYVAAQLQGPPEQLYRKLPEEATEIVLACLTDAKPTQIRSEAADVLFQLLLLLAKHDIPVHEVVAELQERHQARAEVN